MRGRGKDGRAPWAWLDLGSGFEVEARNGNREGRWWVAWQRGEATTTAEKDHRTGTCEETVDWVQVRWWAGLYRTAGAGTPNPRPGGAFCFEISSVDERPSMDPLIDNFWTSNRNKLVKQSAFCASD